MFHYIHTLIMLKHVNFGKHNWIHTPLENDKRFIRYYDQGIWQSLAGIFSSLDFRQTVVLNAQASLKVDSRIGWPNNFLNVLEWFSPWKRKLSNFRFRSIFIFNKKRVPKLSFRHLPKKRSVRVFDVTNRTNGFYSFQSHYQVLTYLFNSLAKSCTLYSYGHGTRIYFFEIISKFKYFGDILIMLHEE